MKDKYVDRYVRFTERNEHEGETWHFFIPTYQNVSELKKLRKIVWSFEDNDECGDSFDFDSTLVRRDQIPDYNEGGYMNKYNILTGKLILRGDDWTSEDYYENFYKGGIRDFMKK